MFRARIKSKFEEDISLLISLDNHRWQYICDCGQASTYNVKEYQNTRAIFISHTHIDHFIGWDEIMRHQIGSKKRVSICGPKGIARQIQAKLLAYTWNLIEPQSIQYEIREILDGQQVNVYELNTGNWDLVKVESFQSNIVYQDLDFEVRYTILDHKTASIAYRFNEKDRIKIDLSDQRIKGGKWVARLKEAFALNDPEVEIEIDQKMYKAGDWFHLLSVKKGHSLGVIMDHAAHEENHKKIKALFSNCDQVYIESFFNEADKEMAQLHYHSYSRLSAEIMRAAKVKKAIPIHFSKKYKEEDIKALQEEFYAAFSG